MCVLSELPDEVLVTYKAAELLPFHDYLTAEQIFDLNCRHSRLSADVNPNKTPEDAVGYHDVIDTRSGKVYNYLRFLV